MRRLESTADIERILLRQSREMEALQRTKAQVRRELIESLDERDQETIHEIVGQLLNPQPIAKSGYLAHLREIFLTLGHQGDVVIVGRGARTFYQGATNPPTDGQHGFTLMPTAGHESD